MVAKMDAALTTRRAGLAERPARACKTPSACSVPSVSGRRGKHTSTDRGRNTPDEPYSFTAFRLRIDSPSILKAWSTHYATAFASGSLSWWRYSCTASAISSTRSFRSRIKRFGSQGRRMQ